MISINVILLVSVADLFGKDSTKAFIDDSALNCREAQRLGWTTVHLVEPSVTSPPQQVCKYQVENLEELRGIFPRFFKQDS